MIQVSELRSHRLPLVPSARMDRATAAQWRHDMAATIAEERRPQRVSNIKLKSEIDAPYYVEANFDKSASKKRSIDELKKAPHGLSLSSNDESIRSKAEQLSKRCEKASRQLMTDMLDDFTEAAEKGQGETFALKLAGVLVEVVSQVVESGGSPAPRIMGDDVIATMAAVRRTWCAKWWRRRLNTDFKRWKEAQHIANGRVGRGRSAYVSKDALKDRAEQIKRNSDLLKAFVAMNDEAVVSLEDCAAASVSNPKIRRHEVMTRLRGLEEWSDSVGMVSHFWTLTAPSRFHRFRTGENGRLYDNPKWDKSTPKEAQAYLVKVWSCIRAEYGRRGLTMTGFRVVEPHHDGCPHWHLLVFSEPEQIEQAAAIAKKHALKDSPDESGAEKRRFVVEA
ncbi:MAG: replication endonuclease, partial [Gallionellaceae bacterium]